MNTIIKFVSRTMIASAILLAAADSVVGQNVGIGTTDPKARLHVADSSVVFSGAAITPANPAPPPVKGPGKRLMWYADKAAFRLGVVSGDSWDSIHIGFGSIVMGLNGKAKGDYSMALGINAEVRGFGGISIGNTNVIDSAAEYSLGLGFLNNLFGKQSTAIGNQNNIAGQTAHAVGNLNTINANSAQAYGSLNTLNGVSSTALGRGLTMPAFRGVSVGSYNSPFTQLGGSTWFDEDPLLVVGNGRDEANRSTAFTILKNGNIGIGTTTPHPSAILDIQAANKGLRLPNLSTVQRNTIMNPANGLLVFDTDLRQMVYHANGRWLGIDSSASFWTKAGSGKLTSVLPNVNINTNYAENIFTLALAGPAVILNGSDNTDRSRATLFISDTLASRTFTTGITIQKTQPGGNHFLDLFLNGTKSRGVFGVNFKNGNPAEKNPQIILDSSGNVGIGQSIEQDSVLLGQLHVFGSQRIQGVGGARLTLHGETGNFTKSSEITFQQNPTGTSEIIRSARYFMRLNGTEADTENEKTSFALGYFIGGIAGLPATTQVGFTQNRAGQIGIRRYPEKTLTSIDVDIDGFTRISGGLQLQGMDEGTGKILVSNSIGSATWQNPEKITLDQPSASGLASLEFRNNGTYRGAIGWSQTDGRFFMFDGESGQNVFFINNGRFGIRRDATTNALEVGGDASKSTAGSWLGNSDARLKKNMMPIQSALDQLLQLKGITYEWNDNSTGYTRPNGTQFGFTAQNVQEVFPTMVSSDAQGYLQTAYGTYDPLIVEAIRELKVENEQLKKEIEAIKALLLKK